jgi:hypothetical protein
MSAYSYPYTEANEGAGIFYKIFLSVVITIAGAFHAYTVYRVFKYLSNK